MPAFLTQVLAPLAAALALAACAPQTPTSEGGAPMERLSVQADAQTTREFWVEIADDEEERQKGLMFRESLGADRGMLFDFGRPVPGSFWMKNTMVPLDIIFIGEDGRVRNVGANTIPFSTQPVLSDGPIRYVLEINAGQAATLGIDGGDKVVHRLIPQ